MTDSTQWPNPGSSSGSKNSRNHSIICKVVSSWHVGLKYVSEVRHIPMCHVRQSKELSNSKHAQAPPRQDGTHFSGTKLIFHLNSAAGSITDAFCRWRRASCAHMRAFTAATTAATTTAENGQHAGTATWQRPRAAVCRCRCTCSAEFGRYRCVAACNAHTDSDQSGQLPPPGRTSISAHSRFKPFACSGCDVSKYFSELWAASSQPAEAALPLLLPRNVGVQCGCVSSCIPVAAGSQWWWGGGGSMGAC